MKVITTCFLGAVVTLAHPLAAQSPISPQCDPQVQLANLQSGGEVQLVAVNETVAVEKLQGKAAFAHLQNLLSRNPAAFAAAKQSLQRRGFTPTETVYVERTLRRARNQGFPESPTPMFAQSFSETNGDGEIVFWSWDDGNSGTWEGTIYVEVYRDGAASTWEGQINDSTTDHPWIYYRKTWEGRDGGPIEVREPSRPGWFQQAVPAVFPGAGSQVQGNILPVSFYGWAVCWRSAVVSGCTAAAIGCRFSGPAWPGCFGAWCVGVEVGSAIGCYLAN